MVGPSLRKFKDRPGGWKWLNVADFKRLPHPPGGVGEGGRKGKKRKLRQTKARQTEDEQREGDSLFKRASTVTVRGRITWFGVPFALLFFFLSFFLSFFHKKFRSSLLFQPPLLQSPYRGMPKRALNQLVGGCNGWLTDFYNI